MKTPRSIALSILALAGTVTLAATLPSFRDQDPEQPTEHHKRLLESVGKWAGKLTWNEPDGNSQSVDATEVVTAIGSFWVHCDFRCDMMGQPYIGSGHTGYDPKAKKYLSSWVDSMGSVRLLMEGTYDADTNSINMEWIGPDMTGKMVPHRSESVHTSDSYVSTFYAGAGDTEQETMVIEMKRVKGATADASADKK